MTPDATGTRPVLNPPCTLRIPAKPTGLWTHACTFVKGPLLEIMAAPGHTWAYADTATARCGPDGDADSLLSRERCLVSTAPVGALIGKIGGSTAGVGDGFVQFVVGSYCVVRVPDDGGPLFLTINDESAGMENNSDSIDVSITELPSPVTSKPSLPAWCALIARLAKIAGCAPEVETDGKTGGSKPDEASGSTHGEKP